MSRRQGFLFRGFRFLYPMIVIATARAVPAAPLDDFVKRDEPAYAWSKVSETPLINGGRSVTLSLTSQTWMGKTWTHRVTVILPSILPAHSIGVVYVTGDYNAQEVALLTLIFGGLLPGPFVILSDVPNQPLYDGRREDALIAYTFARYLETQDTDWPLLLPMTKSVTRCMDAMQELARKEWAAEIDGFVVAGGSKRGWTTWLAGAVDSRVKGLVPIVYNNLNLSAQLPLHIESFGEYSESIHDYVDIGLPSALSTPVGRSLEALVDPYAYRDRLTMPKLIINGTNDRFWPLTASSLYFDELAGPKAMINIPNVGHTLGDYGRIANGMAAFLTRLSSGQSLPDVTWAFSPDPSGLRLTFGADAPASSGSVWKAESATRDFRDSKWTRSEASRYGEAYTAVAPLPATGFVAMFGEIEFGEGFAAYTLSTVPSIAPPLPSPSVRFDLTGDGNVQINDAINGLRMAVGLLPAAIPALLAADANGNGRIDLADVQKILRAVVGLAAN